MKTNINDKEIKLESLRQRDISIDILKFLAVFLIINSHMDMCYPPRYSMLATGGAIGDSLFLFVSGYTLFMGRMDNFGNWYKRRVNRIFPSAFICAMIWSVLTWSDSVDISRLWGGQFCIAIMGYYVILYFVRKYAIKHVPLIMFLVGLISLVAYVFFFPYKYETGEKGLYGITTLYRWIPYFGFMLMGAYVESNKDKVVSRPVIDGILFLFSLLVFYGIQMAAKKNASVAPYQIVTLVPLMGVIFFFYKLCNINGLEKIYYSKIVHPIIMTVSGLCLESYLIQFAIFTDKLNFLFPLNLFIITMAILGISFICKILARLFTQTFCPNAYDWKAMIKLY